MPVDDNAIMQAINDRHKENREDIRAQGERLDAMVEAQQRTAAALESTDSKLDRMCFIVEGDGNGHPGLLRKFDDITTKMDRMVAMHEAVIDFAQRLAKQTVRVIVRYIAPALIVWLAAWFSSSDLRTLVHHFIVEEHMPITAPQSAQRPQDAKAIPTGP